MGTGVILKASQDPAEDLYCLYSTVTDAVTVIGTRGEIRQYLIHNERPRAETDERLEYADRNGTSHRVDTFGTGEFWFGWNVETLAIGDGPGAPGELPRGDLSAYLQAIEANNLAAAAQLVRPDIRD